MAAGVVVGHLKDEESRFATKTRSKRPDLQELVFVGPERVVLGPRHRRLIPGDVVYPSDYLLRAPIDRIPVFMLLFYLYLFNWRRTGCSQSGSHAKLDTLKSERILSFPIRAASIRGADNSISNEDSFRTHATFLGLSLFNFCQNACLVANDILEDQHLVRLPVGLLDLDWTQEVERLSQVGVSTPTLPEMNRAFLI